MTDEEFVLKQTNKERSQMKNGAYHKKSGVKSKSCRLPSDYLTSKEKKALNGPVSSWSMDKFYSWDEFKQMPKDIQEAYLTTISGKYRVGLGTIGRELFGLADSYIFTYLKSHNLKPTIVKTAGTGARNAAKKFALAIKSANDPEPDIPEKTEEPELTPKTPEPVIEVEKPKKEIEINYPKAMSATVTTDKFDATVFNYLGLMFKDKNVQVTITVVET